MGSLLRAKGLTRTYGGIAVVDRVDLEVLPGQVLGLIGPNGGGKSTLLLLLAGLIRPSSGTVEFDGHPCYSLALQAAGSVGLVTARPGLYPALTGRENLAWFAKLYGNTLEALPALAEELQIEAHLDRAVATLSSGQQQKLSLIRALLLQPRLLLFDEPTANLDPVSAASMHAAMRSRADAGTPVVLCTHDLRAAEQICDRVAVMNHRIHQIIGFDGERRAPIHSSLYAAFEAAG